MYLRELYRSTSSHQVRKENTGRERERERAYRIGIFSLTVPPSLFKLAFILVSIRINDVTLTMGNTAEVLSYVNIAVLEYVLSDTERAIENGTLKAITVGKSVNT